MKKAISLIMTAAALLTILASCGTKDGEITTASETAAETTVIADTTATASSATTAADTTDTAAQTTADTTAATSAAAADTTAAAVVIKEGNYGDEYSQRAGATVTKNGDSYIIDVTWSSSAAEGYEWTMTATPDGDKLSYSDCKKVEYSYANDEETREETTIYDNGTGYFVVENGKLLWTGAADAECQNCVFSN